ncbi:hypothetical protein J3U75_04430 [Snodgrassella sp. B3088]|uniref:hypothetical protein n=1 Tax=Snodgrassella sp. B3088 TaxID=2818038 RepID=UPI00226A5AD3|nr:hypothetical protein [Snodgrassella sp. B3088]MCX8748636.1 hypothetical protein [Snodgrassella sp. B3088]
MTYLEFYQAWLDLVLQNNQIFTHPKTYCALTAGTISSYIETALLFITFPILQYACCRPNKRLTTFLIIYYILIFAYWTFINYIAASDPRCKEEVLTAPSYSWSEYAEYDYTSKEFNKNMAILRPDASPEQIELAKTVVKNCLKHLPSGYQANHSSIVRHCIDNDDTKKVFEQTDTKIYMNKTLNKINQIR